MPTYPKKLAEPARLSRTCKWPIGDPGTPGFHFCAAAAMSGKPYCPEHQAKAFVKVANRQTRADKMLRDGRSLY